MKYFNCFVKYRGRNKHSMFIQIPENVMNSSSPTVIEDKIRKEIAEEHGWESDFARITQITILGYYESTF